MKYRIEFTREQLSVVQQACEFMSRFCTGQLDMLPQSFLGYLHKKNKEIDEYCDKRDKWEYGLKITKQAMFPELSTNASYGIGSKYEPANVCYDIYRPILEQFDAERRETILSEPKSWSVYSSPGLTTSKEGRISIKTIK
jgi:hypothetical protein